VFHVPVAAVQLCAPATAGIAATAADINNATREIRRDETTFDCNIAAFSSSFAFAGTCSPLPSTIPSLVMEFALTRTSRQLPATAQ